MTALEDIKKAFPNMFRPLKWHHFDGPTEHGCGEWYAHATRGMYHIYDVREKFSNDRPFYAKELSDQFDTLEQAQDAVQNRHELDILMCLDPDFRSTLESLQRENKELRHRLKAPEPDLTCPHIDKLVETGELSIEAIHELYHIRDINSMLRYGLWHEKSRAEAAEAEVKRLITVVQTAHVAMTLAFHMPGVAEEYDFSDAIAATFQALASTGCEHHAE